MNDQNQGETPSEQMNGTAETAAAQPAPDPELMRKLATLRSHMRESFGSVVMTMMALPRYRHQSLADLQHLVLEPMIRDRVAIAFPGNRDDQPLADIAGVAIWESVSDEVDARIREQAAAGVFPVRLKAEDWNSGANNWLLDVIAPDQRAITSVIANFRQLVKEGGLKLHPRVVRLLDPEALQKLGATRAGAADQAPAPSEAEREPAA